MKVNHFPQFYPCPTRTPPPIIIIPPSYLPREHSEKPSSNAGKTIDPDRAIGNLVGEAGLHKLHDVLLVCRHLCLKHVVLVVPPVFRPGLALLLGTDLVVSVKSAAGIPRIVLETRHPALLLAPPLPLSNFFPMNLAFDDVVEGLKYVLGCFLFLPYLFYQC